MTAAELIAALQKVDPDTTVAVPYIDTYCYYDGHEPVTRVVVPSENSTIHDEKRPFVFLFAD